MAVNRNTNAYSVTRNGKYNLHTNVKFLQLNLQHSRIATDNLTKLIAEHGTDILLIQEPYIIKNKTVGISRRHKVFTHGEQRTRQPL